MSLTYKDLWEGSAMRFIPCICMLYCVDMCLPRMELYTNHEVGSTYIRTEEFAN